jgi:hypothetical protein
MNKTELLQWLQEEYQQWEAFLAQIDPARMQQPDVAGDWSIKDIIAHLTNWQRRNVARIEAAQHGAAEPSSLWPAHLQSDDEVNAWIYETNRQRPLREVLDESHHVFQQTLAVVEGLPDDVQIELVQQGGRVYHPVWLGGERFPPGEFFYHFHDDHEPDIRAWLARVEEP